MTTPPLATQELELILDLFRHHPDFQEVQEVRLFGSRAKGTHTCRSDVDLAVWGMATVLQVENLAAEMDELPLPYRFDVQAFERISHEPLREHIERVGIPIYRCID